MKRIKELRLQTALNTQFSFVTCTANKLWVLPLSRLPGVGQLEQSRLSEKVKRLKCDCGRLLMGLRFRYRLEIASLNSKLTKTGEKQLRNFLFAEI